MEFSWITELLKLLFGQMGVLGTTLMIMFAYVAWQLHLEKLDHRKSRERHEEVTDKRLELLQTLTKTISELERTVSNLVVVNKRSR